MAMGGMGGMVGMATMGGMGGFRATMGGMGGFGATMGGMRGIGGFGATMGGMSFASLMGGMGAPSANSSGSDNEDAKLSPSGLPVREVPGGYGVPFLSPLRDRLDYYYFQGAEEYFRSRIARNGGATVLRVNMPPGPFIPADSRVVAFLDARSFSVLLDDAKVDKTDTLDGTFMPSLALFGGYRPLAFLDAADPRHAALKRVMISLAAARMHHVAPVFRIAFGAVFDAADAGLGDGPVQFNKLNEHHMFDFTCSALFGGTPPSKAMGDGAVTKAIKWLGVQLHPLASKIIKPWLLEDLLLYTFRLPPLLVRRDYADLTAYFAEAAAGFLNDADKAQSGISRDELLHNLVFTAIFNAYGGFPLVFPAIFNAYGGFKIFLPHVIKWLARAGPALHARLASEPAEENKQCPGKDMVVAVGRLMVAELFRRYDTFTADVKEMPLEPVVTFTSLTSAKAE
ncbi:Allene oxide synthase 4 [Triticum urartu]|uniref:Allene oxide synthase 4 n=1 Tax=Triticum urartu TaxID=4572 RepID=M7Z256_TRIUA|nr:Allene oxide synthase 4 [Triticum urartu]